MAENPVFFQLEIEFLFRTCWEVLLTTKLLCLWGSFEKFHMIKNRIKRPKMSLKRAEKWVLGFFYEKIWRNHLTNLSNNLDFCL